MNEEIKFKSVEHLALFINKFMNSEQGTLLAEPYRTELAVSKYINIHGYD